MDTRWIILAAGVSTGFLVSCLKVSHHPYEDHCTTHDGDNWCAERHPDGDRPFCILASETCSMGLPLEHTGCVKEQPDQDSCYSPCGDFMTIVENLDCMSSTDDTSDASGTDDGGSTDEGTTGDPQTGTGSSESGSSTTGPVPCGGPEDCMGSEAPYCSAEGVCVACDQAPTAEEGDAACAAADAMTPACTADGACVTCTETVTQVCDEALLLCDSEANTCIPCVEHADCVSGACHIAEGTCFPDDVSVAHVDEDGGQDFTSITAAIGAVADGGFGIIIVHELNGGDDYSGFTVDGGKTAALFAEPGEDPIVQGAGGAPGLSITGAETAVYIEAVDFVANSMGLGLVVDAGTAWVDRSRIVQNSGGGVLAQGGANLTLRNCFVGGPIDGDAISVNASSARILYTSILASFGDANALACTNPTVVDLRNSIATTRGDNPALACAGVTVTTSAVEDTANTGWFDDYNNGDASLTPLGETQFETVATWLDGDPRVDIDGDSRPEENGTPDVAGADVP